MLKNRIILIAASALVIWLIFLLPKVVVENDSEMAAQNKDSVRQQTSMHNNVPAELSKSIQNLRAQFSASSENEKNAIFADSLAKLYQKAGKYDSAAWFEEEKTKFFNTTENWIKTGDRYYEAYSFAIDQDKQNQLAEKAQQFYKKVLEVNPKNLDVKTKMAMTYVSSANPMQGILLLREVIATDPKNELALFNLGMLSIQSGQYDKAVERLEELNEINPNNSQGQLLLGIAYMNTGKKAKAREQFEKVKQMEKDPAVQATVDSYLKDLK
ncbi:MAG TPA: tetratricopeptide repeat protein [Chryseolinea sp.]|nr:tetratricopeptide repeat protein [Chryseolinea sp.]HPH45728.1 tetratricopeptide repeat protein [Chryseolinea sp.]HPM29017.1 tetratricopeptide repeat protein [Chryseolinea sp.]